MLQDIEPRKFKNEFEHRELELENYVFIFRGEDLLIRGQEGDLVIPRASDFEEQYGEMKACGQYLFSIDGQSYFLLPGFTMDEKDGWSYADSLQIRPMNPQWRVFACAAGAEMHRWYEGNRFCGRCGHKMIHSETERAMCCPDCGRIVYPPLAPSVIVGVTDGDRILLTRYARGAYRKYSLVAGYAEFGETLEKTVAREVMEEVGMKVKNIRYYKSQPWPFTDSLLVGYFAEVDGSTQIRLQEEELSEATWYSREELPPTEGALSLTNEMIEVFRSGGSRI